MPVLDFKGKSVIYSHHLRVPFRSLEIDEKKSISKKSKNGKTEKPSLDDNLIIHGDNLHALKALLPRYSGKVKCIYIDPPYNTGNEGWKYNDKVNSPIIKEWLKQNGIGTDDLERHDKWLCMMWPRLQLLKELLSDDGVIFVSIDSNEQFRLMAIMEEIFGIDNFISDFIIVRAEGGGLAKQVIKGHDYVLVYSKNISKFKPLKKEKDIRGKIIEKEGVQYWLEEDWLRKEFGKYGTCYYEEIEKYKGKDKKSEIDIGLKKGLYRLIKKGKYHIVGRMRKLNEDGSKFYSVLKHLSAKGINDINEIGIKFEYPKPVSLIRELILGATFNETDKDSIILDSFAGSGTTAHAVLDLNKEDGGNRKFILVECEDYADKITAERVRRVIKGVPKAKEEKLKKGLGGSFTYCALGKEINTENLLMGKNLPDYKQLAEYVFYTATGESLNKVAKANPAWFIGETSAYRLHLVYQPDLNFLRSKESALHEDLAETIKKFNKGSNKVSLVFAPAKYITQKELLKDYNIQFCQLPYDIHKLMGA